MCSMTKVSFNWYSFTPALHCANRGEENHEHVIWLLTIKTYIWIIALYCWTEIVAAYKTINIFQYFLQNDWILIRQMEPTDRKQKHAMKHEGCLLLGEYFWWMQSIVFPCTVNTRYVQQKRPLFFTLNNYYKKIKDTNTRESEYISCPDCFSYFYRSAVRLITIRSLLFKS